MTGETTSGTSERTASHCLPLLPGWVRWSLVLAVGGSIFYLSIVTAPPETVFDTRPRLVPLDKWRHFLAYAAFGGVLAYATTDRKRRARRTAVLVVAATLLYGLGIEVGQSFLPDRYFSLADAYGNALGAAFLGPWYAVRRRVEFVPAREWIRERVAGRRAEKP
ncbi:hypothetical protein BRC83_09425 [Halobacteriales archaeon QS_1_68_17]|nr:MAG: hypothetical protein BRC83_09425 [Halobacteriales archaeon QS_1_68_17]